MNTTYIDEIGQLYKLVPEVETGMPEFGTEISGDLLYIYSDNKEEIPFYISDDGELSSEMDLPDIDETGSLYHNNLAVENDISYFTDEIGNLIYRNKKGGNSIWSVSDIGQFLTEYDNVFIDDIGRLGINIKWSLVNEDTELNVYFLIEDNGNLIYRNKNGETLEFLVDDNGHLLTQYDESIIDENGYLLFFVNEGSQKEINLLRSHNKKIQMRVTLYEEIGEGDHKGEITVEDLTGKIKSCDFDKTLSSDIRNTCTLTLSVPAKEQINLDFERTWNRRMVELHCGIYYAPDKDYVWYNLGRMLMTGGSTRYDATTQEVKLNLVDLMASLTADRGSQIGSDILIQAGSDTKKVIEMIIDQFGVFKRYNVCTFDSNDATIPYDIEINSGAYPIDVLMEILDLFPKYEMFYDEAGIFTVQKIPTKLSDPIEIKENIIDDMLISESKSIDFSEIKNTTEIWGRELSGDYTAKSCTTNGDTYNVYIDETFTELVNNETYTIVPHTTSISGQKIKIQNLPPYEIYTATGAGVYTPLVAGAMVADVPYVVQYFEGSLEENEEESEEDSGKMFVLQGELQVRCIVQEIKEAPSISAMIAYEQENNCNNVAWIVNPDSPFACWIEPTTHRIKGEIKQVLSGGEYENIYTTNLAYERAKYENWLRCRLQDTIEVEMILIPWMELNQKIRFTSPVSNELGVWIVQGITYDFKRWTMTVKASRFYPSDPWEEV